MFQEIVQQLRQKKENLKKKMLQEIVQQLRPEKNLHPEHQKRSHSALQASYLLVINE